MISGRSIKPAFEIDDLVFTQAGYQFFKDLHHSVPAFLAILQVFKTNPVYKAHVATI